VCVCVCVCVCVFVCVFVCMRVCVCAKTMFILKSIQELNYISKGPELLPSADTSELDVWLTVHRNSVWIRKTN
jgi:hypothetical protein